MGRFAVSALALGSLVVAGSVVAAILIDDGRGSTDSRAVVAQVVDGDTIVIDSGERVRLIGVDTPERGTCGHNAATEAMRRKVSGRKVVLVNPASVQDVDAYGRLLRFVEVGDSDAGLAQIRSGLGRARYDSRDGYDEHPREERYHRADRQSPGLCER